ncbi:MAG TPA: RsmD family RNA methyltransferase [Actinomycetota bacterium]
MRVIGGSAKGTRLARPPGGTRPVADRVREGLFSSLGETIQGARCLDLYAGTGAVGIEALSRGAASCTFVDATPAAVRVIRDNLARTHLEGRVVRADAGRFLARPSGPYDLAFVDPPYGEPANRLKAVLAQLPDRLAPDARFVLTRPGKGSTDVVPVHFLVERRLSYGDSLVVICRRDR